MSTTAKICIACAILIILLVVVVLLIVKHRKKYQPHFRKFHDNVTQGHPQYVYGKNKKNYKTVGITHAPTTDNTKNIPMKQNPELGNSEPAYMLPRPNRVPKRTRNKKLQDWSLSKEDEKTAKKIARKRPRKVKKKKTKK